MFYETFTAKPFKDAVDVKKFSDIPLVDFHNQALCKEAESPWKKSYKGHKNIPLFKKYATHLANMIEKTQKNERKLLAILEKLFVYWIDPVKKTKKLTINPNLTNDILNEITIETRNIILQLYVECEKDFQEGLKIFEAIISKSMLQTTQRQISNFKKMSKNA